MTTRRSFPRYTQLVTASALLATCLAAAPPAAMAQVPDRFEQLQVRTPGGLGQGFAVRNPGGTPRCLVITARHVVAPAQPVALRSGRALGSELAPSVPARLLEQLPIDAAVLLPEQAVGTCDVLAGPDDTRQLLESDTVGRVLRVAAEGGNSSVRVVVDWFDGESLLFSGIGRSRPKQGDSGALLSISGTPVGMVVSVEPDGTGRALRLDYLARIASKYVAVKAPPQKPYDESRLPSAVAEAVRRARTARGQAENSQRLALEKERLADEAVIATRAKAPGHSEMRPSTQNDRVHRGQVADLGKGLGGFGPGVTEFTGDGREGDFLKGEFRPTDGGNKFGLHGVGVAIYGQNANNPELRIRYEGSWVEGVRSGAGVTTFRDQVVYGTLSGDRYNGHMVIERKADRWRWEGSAKNNSGEIGVWWDSDGQPIHVGRWREGNYVGPVE